MRTLRDQYPSSRPESSAPPWAITYGDLMTILLVFFVLIAAYSSFDVVKYRSLVGSVQTALGTRDRSLDNPQLDSAPTQGIASAAEERERKWVEDEVEAVVADIGGPLQMLETSDGTRVRIEGEALFASGKSELLPQAKKLLDKLAPSLKRYPYEIMIEGHTDDRPIKTSAFPSNWELSSARAASVVRHLRSTTKMRARQLVAVGYADTRPLKENIDSESRAKNRRVEMLFSVPRPQKENPNWIRDPIGSNLPSTVIRPQETLVPSTPSDVGTSRPSTGTPAPTTPEATSAGSVSP